MPCALRPDAVFPDGAALLPTLPPQEGDAGHAPVSLRYLSHRHYDKPDISFRNDRLLLPKSWSEQRPPSPEYRCHEELLYESEWHIPPVPHRKQARPDSEKPHQWSKPTSPMKSPTTESSPYGSCRHTKCSYCCKQPPAAAPESF